MNARKARSLIGFSLYGAFNAARQNVLNSPVARAGAVRAITLPVTIASTLGATAITIRSVGATAYGYVALLATLSALLPFADLGLGTSLQTAAAVATRRGEDYLRAHLVAALRLLFLSASVLVAVGFGLGLSGAWNSVLGIPDSAPISANSVAPLVVLCFAASLPLGVGSRLLIGLGRNDVSVAISASGSVFVFAVTLLLALSHAHASSFALAQPVSAFLVALVASCVALRLTGFRGTGIVASMFRAGRSRGTSVVSTAAPMLVVMMGLPLALQSDRIILAHQSTAKALGQYAIGAQVYATVWGIIYAAGVSLWPRFAQQRDGENRETLGASWWKALRGFCITGLIAGLALAFAIPACAEGLSRGDIVAPKLLTLGFALFVLVHATHMPSAMFLTSPRMLWFQAGCVIAMVGMNLPLSWILAGKVGAAGPVLASVIAVSLCQLVPGIAASRFAISARPRS